MTNKLLDTVGSNSASPKLLVFGNPLLDITVQIKNDDLLKRYQLEKNGQKEVSLEKLSKLIGDASASYKTMNFSLGGSGLNSSRILAAMGQRELLFFGAIGDDQNGKIVKEILERSHVNSCLQQLKDIKTGTCLCLCQGEERSLTANIGAALKIEKSFVAENLKTLKSLPSLYYIEGFFIPEKMNICRFLYEKYSKSSDSLLITNLNAPYIVKSFSKDITWLAQRADVVFGNRDEFEELASINGFQTMEDLLTDMLNGFKCTKKKIIVVTDGANPVFYYEGNSASIESSLVNVPQVKLEDIIDTTGAGDSFVAGFIFALMEGKPTRECIELGCEVSARVIRVIGCNLPKELKD